MDDGAALTKPRNLGGSLPVPNVQDLAARRDLTPAVLNRYLRDDDDATATCPVPVVDLGRLLDDDGEHTEEEAAKLRSACEDWGFFLVINHGVAAKVVDDVKGFFQIPLAEKLAFAQEPGGVEGYGQAFVVSEEQKLDFSDMYHLLTQPPEYRDLKLWPSSSSSFRDSLQRYSAEAQRVATALLRAMAKNLGLEDAEKLTRLAGSQSVRMNYYPACPQAHVDRVLGLSPHSDAVGLTLLLQVGPVPGLQIRRRGAWVPVEPAPGALVANVGDVVEVLTNGRYRSVEHRAVVNARHERVSVAAFHSARFGGTYGPLEEMLAGGGGGEARYRTVTVEDYLKLVFSSKLDGKNIMDAMKINPSPP